MARGDHSTTSPEKPPYDASPDNLERVCVSIINGSSRTVDLVEDDAVSLSKQPINRNIGYGVRLGFLKESDGGYDVTSDGETLAHVGSGSADWLFKNAVENYPLYRELLSKSVRTHGLTRVRGNDSVEREVILKSLTEEYDFDLGKRSLKAAASTYLRTLEAAGFGSYVKGDGEYPTRLELDKNVFDSFLLGSQDELDVEEIEDSSNDTKEKAEVQEVMKSVGGGDVRVPLTTGNTLVNVNVDMGEYEVEKTAEKIARFAQELEDELNSEEFRE